MEGAKILLSPEELALVQNTHWLLTKNSIIEKTKQLFGRLAESLQQQLAAKMEKLPHAVHLFSPKISRGEYYQGLPYVMLDYPRVFSKEDVFAMRTMFWWGNFFSVTLQLKGSYQQQFAPVLVQHQEQLASDGFHLAVSADEWRHDFEADNYELIGENLGEAMNGAFVKIAVQVPLSQWNDAEELLRLNHEKLIKMLAA